MVLAKVIPVPVAGAPFCALEIMKNTYTAAPLTPPITAWKLAP
jgi:hypothetical protein